MAIVYFASSVSGNVTTPANAVGAPDAAWTGNTNSAWTHRWRLSDPGGVPSGTQSISLRLRRGGSTATTPTLNQVTLYQNSVSLGTLLASPVSVNTTGQDVTVTFNASVLDGIFALLDLELTTTLAGSGGTRSAVQIDGATATLAVAVAGSLAAAESGGPDTLAAAGMAKVSTGSLVATESGGQDGLACSGAVTTPPRTGAMAAAENVGADTFLARGPGRSGSLAASEPVSKDKFVGFSGPSRTGSLVAAEAGNDGFASYPSVETLFDTFDGPLDTAKWALTTVGSGTSASFTGSQLTLDSGAAAGVGVYVHSQGVYNLLNRCVYVRLVTAGTVTPSDQNLLSGLAVVTGDNVLTSPGLAFEVSGPFLTLKAVSSIGTSIQGGSSYGYSTNIYWIRLRFSTTQVFAEIHNSSDIATGWAALSGSPGFSDAPNFDPTRARVVLYERHAAALTGTRTGVATFGGLNIVEGVPRTGKLIATEGANDTLAGAGTVPLAGVVAGTLAATESGPDTLAGSGGANWPVSALVESFDGGLDSAVWFTDTTAGASLAFSAGRLRLTTLASASSWAHLWSLKRYALANGSAVAVRLVTPAAVTPGDAALESGFVLVDQNYGAGYHLGWWADGTGRLHAAWRNAWAWQDVHSVASYNPSTYRWLRVRADATTVYWDSAPESASNPPAPGDWVNRASVLRSALPFASLNALQLTLFQTSNAGTTGTPGTTEFDGLNTASSDAASGRTGNLAASETTADTLAAPGGKVKVAGPLAATEGAADTLASPGGKVIVKGPLAVTETGADTLAGAGSARVTRIGTLAATESTSDTLAGVGQVPRRGSWAATETGADTWAGAGQVLVKGPLAASETGADTLAGAAKLVVKGPLAASEAGLDTLAASAKVLVKGPLAATETGADTLAGLAQLIVQGPLAVGELGADALAGVAKLTVGGALGAAEVGTDSFEATSELLATGSLSAAEETRPDTWTGSGVASVASASANFASSLSGTATTPANALGAIDGVFTANTNSSWTHRWRLAAVTGTPSGTQSISLRLRRGGSATTTPTLNQVTLYQNSVSRGTLLGAPVGISNSTSQDMVVSFDASVLNGTFDVLDLELQTTLAGASSTRSAVQVDAATATLARQALSSPVGWFTAAEAGADALAASGSALGTAAGALAATESGADALAAQAQLIVKGAAAAQEAGADTLASSARVLVQGAGLAQELSADALVGLGRVVVQGAWVASETGADSFAASGAQVTLGAWAASEAGGDALSMAGQVRVRGPLAAAENAAPDSAALSGRVRVAGTLATAESSADALAVLGQVRVAGTLNALESGADTLAASGSQTARGALAAGESGVDTLTGLGGVRVAGLLASAEAGADTASAAGAVRVAGAFSAQDAGADSVQALGRVEQAGALVVYEAGADALAAAGRVRVAGAGAALETSADTLASSGQVVPMQTTAGQLAAQEAGMDAAAASGRVVVAGAAAVSEPVSDTAQAGGRVAVAGAGAASEGSADTVVVAGRVLVLGIVLASEAGADGWAGSGMGPRLGQLAASEGTGDTLAGRAQLRADELFPLAGQTQDFALAGQASAFPLAGQQQSFPL